MNQLLMAILAQATNPANTTAPPTTQGVQGPWWAYIFGNPLFIVVIVFGVMIYFQIRTKRTQERQRQDMLGQLKRGDRVQTIGGILGTVIEAREDEVLVKVDETTNAKIHFARTAIHRVLDSEKK